jgi:hypothetical protein
MKKIAGFTNYIASYSSPGEKEWWKKQGWERFGYPYYSYWETFTNQSSSNKTDKSVSGLTNSDKTDNSLLAYPPNTPAPADLSIRNPYHLLADEMKPPREIESLSCVNSRNCYATDFNARIEKTGNYRQLTNNYKRGYPDSCTSPFQELVLNFYKTDGM